MNFNKYIIFFLKKCQGASELNLNFKMYIIYNIFTDFWSKRLRNFGKVG